VNLTKSWAAELEDYVIDLAWSPDGGHLAAASSSGPIALFGAADGTKRELPGHDGGTNCIAWTPASTRRLLASGGQDGTVRLWEGASGIPAAAARLSTGWVEHLEWNRSPEGKPALAATAGRRLALLGADGAVIASAADAPKTVSAITWGHAQKSGPVLAAAHFGGVRIFDAETLALKKELPYGNGIHALVWSPDGKWLVSGNQDPSVHLWIPEIDEEFQMSGYETKVKFLSFDCSSRWLATAGGKDACVWDCSGAGPEGRAPEMFPHDGPVTALAFQNAHGLLASAAQDKGLNLWSPDRRQPLRASARIPAPASRLAWSPDDRFLAVGTEAGQVFVLQCEA
jgi:WD40 repeat protein